MRISKHFIKQARDYINELECDDCGANFRYKKIIYMGANGIDVNMYCRPCDKDAGLLLGRITVVHKKSDYSN